MTNLSEELKSDFFSKIKKLIEISTKQEEIKEDTNLSEDVLLDADPDLDENRDFAASIDTWQCLDKVRLEAVNSLRYTLALMNCNPISFPGNKMATKLLEEVVQIYGQGKEQTDDQIKFILDGINQIGQNEIIHRYRQLKPLVLSSEHDYRSMGLYQQAIKCFLNGTFEACCILCRAIAERLVKKRIVTLGHGEYLHHGKNGQFAPPLLEIAEKFGVLSVELREKYREISRPANRFLHSIDEQERSISWEGLALSSIERLQEFITRFPEISKNKI